MDIIKTRGPGGISENLFSKKSREKINKLVRNSTSCFVFLDMRLNKPLPVLMKHIDNEGAIWFIVPVQSIGISDLSNKEYAQLLFHAAAFSDFLSLLGRISVSKEKSMMKEFQRASKKRIPDQKDYRLIKFDPAEGYFWNTKLKRVVALEKKNEVLSKGRNKEITGERKSAAG